jgi:hypothetical protein
LNRSERRRATAARSVLTVSGHSGTPRRAELERRLAALRALRLVIRLRER